MKNYSIIYALFFLINTCAYTQTEEETKYQEYNDLQYLNASLVENDTAQRLNLVLPNEVKDAPLLVWIGGGAWSYVNRNMEMDIARQFAKEGIAVASVGHRLSSAFWRDSTHNGGAQHPDHIEDIAAAFKWLYDRADEYGYDTKKIFVGGFSSGAHLAALLSLDEKYLKKNGLSKENIRGVISISGAYDIPNYHEVFKNGNNPHLAELHVESVFGKTKNQLIDGSPTNYLENLSVPMFLIADNMVHRYTHLFEDEIMETDFRNFDVLYVYKLNHGELWREMAQDNSNYRNMIKNFIFNQSNS